MNLLEAAIDLEDAADDLIAALEAQRKRSYYMEEITLKRWVPGDGGKSGNCENCVEAADEGWVDMDYVYDMFDEDVDEPPGHPNDTCSIEWKDTTRRVYA